MARFGDERVQPARCWRGEFAPIGHARLFAGLAGHSLLSFDRPMSSAVGMILVRLRRRWAGLSRKAERGPIPEALITA